jgi:hypothetical protein
VSPLMSRRIFGGSLLAGDRRFGCMATGFEPVSFRTAAGRNQGSRFS